MKTFTDLISFCDPVSLSGSVPKTLGRLRQDSRQVQKGDIFIAIDGTRTDGHAFIPQAISNGAAIIIIDRDADENESVCTIKVKNTRALIGPLAQAMAGYPGKNLIVVGITGTNGKTTVATLVWQALTKLGHKASLLGTVEKRINQTVEPSRLTTADPIELADDMKKMVEADSRYLVMEVSSHALHQQRIKGVPFTAAVFTNLSLDHLDYHPSMDEYAEAKKILFDSLNENGWAITNIDDPRGEWIVKDTEARVLPVSFKKDALIKSEIISSSESGMTLCVESTRINTSLIGNFNAYNVVEALITCTALGFDGIHVAKALKHAKGAPGRMERVNSVDEVDHQPVVIVDYAHTPDALDNVSATLNDLKKPGQNLTIVFGCGGDRDKSKRPQMAKIAEKFGDKVIVTSDNPRSEDPEAIIDDILDGFLKTDSVVSIPSREEAITAAIKKANKHSIVLIAGKGHETYQEINGERSHFDDREIARTALTRFFPHPKNGEEI